jgi:hypothetical protein
MSKDPMALARRGAQALTAVAMVAGGAVFAAAPAHAVLPLPTVTSVFVYGTTNNKVITTGTTVTINGTGFSGMVDNSSSGCNTVAAATAVWPAAGSGCSQVRFVGVGATDAATGFAPAAQYTVVSDKLIYATVPAPLATNGTTAGSPAPGTGSMKVQVLNTTGTGTSSGLSASTASEVFYRGPITATVSSPATANPGGGGSLTVSLAGLPTLTNTTYPQEKLSAYVVSTVAGSPTTAATSMSMASGSAVNVVLPPGAPAAEGVNIMVLHDGIPGTAAAAAYEYPAVITKIEGCPSDISTWVGAPTADLPDCSAVANVTGATADLKITGKGLTGATAWNFAGTGTQGTPACKIVSDVLAYCHVGTLVAPASKIAAVSFTPADPPGAATAPDYVATAGSVLLFNGLI